MGHTDGCSATGSDEITQQRTRLTRRVAMFGSPLAILGMVLVIFDLGPERVQLVPFVVGMLINLAGLIVGTWRYPRPLGG